MHTRIFWIWQNHQPLQGTNMFAWVNQGSKLMKVYQENNLVYYLYEEFNINNIHLKSA